MFNTIHEITNVERPSYDKTYGMSKSTRDWFGHITNFDARELDNYRRAIATFKGPGEFGISNEAYGFDEDIGQSWALNNVHGFFTQGVEDTAAFFKHLKSIKQGI